MARFNFGGALTDFAILPPSGQSNVVKSQPNVATGQVYAARTGGSALTDLLDSSGNPTTTVGTDANGFLNRFQGPDGATDLWVDFGGGSRFHLVTSDLGSSAAPIDLLSDVVTGAGGSTGPNLILGTAAHRNSSAIASDVATSVILNPGAGAGQNNIIGGNGAATVGTSTPNATTTGTNASVSVVGGYDNVAGALSSKIISDHSYVGVDATEGHNAIFGGSNNIIDGAGTGHAGIFSGYNCHVSADLGFAEGQNNVVSGVAGIAMGDNNTVSGTRGLATGASNTVSGSYGRAHGQLNQIDSTSSFASAEGQYAYARNPGQRAVSSGRIAALGDCQTSVTHYIKQTTNATEAKMVPGTSVLDFVMVRGQTVLVECMFVARTVGGASQGAWVVKTVCAWDATGASFNLGTPVVDTLYTANASLAVRVDAVSSIGAILPKVTGLAATTINWSARMTTVEIVA